MKGGAVLIMITPIVALAKCIGVIKINRKVGRHLFLRVQNTAPEIETNIRSSDKKIGFRPWL